MNIPLEGHMFPEGTAHRRGSATIYMGGQVGPSGTASDQDDPELEPEGEGEQDGEPGDGCP